MKTTILSALLLMLGLSTVWGQSFSVTGSNPTDGTTSVSMSATISVSFSESVNTADTVDWEEYISYEPYDSLYVEDIWFSQDQRTVHFDVTHFGQTDFIWFVLDAPASNGSSLANGYTFTYTTASDLGAHSVSGSISSSSSQSDVLTMLPSTLSFHNVNLERVLAKSARTSAASRATEALQVKKSGYMEQAKQASTTESSQLQNDYLMTFALLMDSNYFDTDTTEGNITAAALVDPSSGAYTIDHVRDGTYWPVVMKYDGGNSMFPFQIGYYDLDQNQVPDSIVVSGSDISGIDMMLRSLEAFTAREGLQRANDIALNTFDDSRLLIVEGYQLGYDQIFFSNSDNETQSDHPNLSGKSQTWTYFYHSPANDSVIAISLLSSDISWMYTYHEETLTTTGEIDSMKTIPSPFIDSDQAMQVAEDNGGSDFRASLDTENGYLMVQMSGGHNYWNYEPDTTADAPLFWNIYYFGLGIDTTGWPSYMWMSVKVDMETGQLLNKTSTSLEKITGLPSQFDLQQNYPNPFNPTTSIPFTLPQSEHVKINIYNLLGQQVAVLADERYPAGEHRISWDATDLSSGVYLYQMTAGTFTQTKKLMLVK